MKTKLANLGSAMVGDKFVWRTAEIYGPNVRCGKIPFEGKELAVVGFMPASYVSRVLVKDQDGSELLLRLDDIEKALRLQTIQVQ